MCALMLAITTAAAPGATTSVNASSTSAVPSRSTFRMTSAGAWVGDTPAVWARHLTGPSSVAVRARARTDSASETSTGRVVT